MQTGDPRRGLLALYDVALPQVYGYLLRRCGRTALAEDLTAETFLAAVDAVRSGGSPPLSTGWLIGIARHKLVDHWRRLAREERTLSAVAGDPDHESTTIRGTRRSTRSRRTRRCRRSPRSIGRR